MPTADEIVSTMRAALALAEPDLDTSIGSVTRKILDAVAAGIAPAYSDVYMANFQYDLDTKTGTDIDDFALNFGLSRIAPARSAGTVTFARTTAATADIYIPPQTQVTTPSTSAASVVVSTVVPAYLVAGESSVDVPVQANIGGVGGNVAANALATLATQLDGISSVFNAAPLTGGSDTEGDDAFKVRFKRTVFRSLAGTESMYLGVALEPYSGTTTPVVTQANVLSASSRRREQVQIAGDGTAISTIPAASVQYVFPGNEVFGPDIDNGSILTPAVHYTFDTSVIPPVIHNANSALTIGGIYDLDFEYVSSRSRNDPLNGITNRVDIWVNGTDPVQATQVSYFDNRNTFGTDPTSWLDRARYVRLNTVATHPASGNFFLRLAFGPLLIVPASLVVGSTTYHYGTDYWAVQEDTASGYTPTSVYGLELASGITIANGASITFSGTSSYTYNQVPWKVEAAIRTWRLVGSDVKVHAAKTVSLLLNFAVMYTGSLTNETAINAALRTALSAFLEGLGFDATIQVSDLLAVAHGVTGIDNIRFVTQTESSTHYAIQQVDPAGSVISTYAASGRAIDVVLGDDTVPVLYDVNMTVKAQNTFSTGA